MQVNNSILENIPQNSYKVMPKDASEDSYILEKKHPFSGARVMGDKLTKDIFTYIPKGMKGSKNSNFYEFLSMGLVPNIIGSAMLILISNGLNNKYGGKDSFFAGMNGKKMGAGVVLYAAGKFLGQKIINKGVQAKTGVDLDMGYKKIIHELPEGPNEDPNKKPAEEFHKVYESATFPRWDLINKMGEAKGNRYEYYDKLAKRMGYKEDLNAPDQVVQPKIREVVVKSNAARSISGYLWAGLGVAIAAQDAFGENFCRFTQKPTFKQAVTELPKQTWKAISESTKELAKTKFGKAMMIGAVASSALGIWNATRTFKADKENTQSTVDYKQNYMEF